TALASSSTSATSATSARRAVAAGPRGSVTEPDRGLDIDHARNLRAGSFGVACVEQVLPPRRDRQLRSRAPGDAEVEPRVRVDRHARDLADAIDRAVDLEVVGHVEARAQLGEVLRRAVLLDRE